jgi:hypothetical protein
MKELRPVQFDRSICASELHRLKRLLASAAELDERNAILPFFRSAPHLSAFLGSYSPHMAEFDRLAYEYSLYGDFTADLVIGDAGRQSYCFVEFEDARSDSVFVSRRGKSTPEWSPRFEHGFSQIVDWFWRLDDARRSTDFAHRIGRDSALDPRDRQRLRWRLERVVIDSKQIVCVTYDQLMYDLAIRLKEPLGES